MRPHVTGHALSPLEGPPALPAPVHFVDRVGASPVVASLVSGLLVVVNLFQVLLRVILLLSLSARSKILIFQL